MNKPLLSMVMGLAVSMMIVGCSTSKQVNLVQISSSSPPTHPKYDTSESFSFSGSWPMPPQFQGNPFSSGGQGSAQTFEFDALFQYTRTTKNFVNELAQSYTNTPTQTIIHLRKNARWSDGSPLTSKDIWAYYMLQYTQVTDYLTSIQTPNPHTVVFNWAQPTPYNQMRLLLIAQDTQGMIPYHIYGKYADRAAQLMDEARKETKKWVPNNAFGLQIPTNIQKKMTQNYAAFTSDTPKLPICSGAYIVKSVNNTDLIMVQNPYYWDRKDVKFKEVWIKQIQQVPAQWAMLKSGQLDYYDGTPPQDVLMSALASNPDLVHFQMDDAASIGMYFNIRKKPFNNEKFRQALAYVFQRGKIRDVGNYYGIPSQYNMSGILPSTMNQAVSPQTRAKMTKYTYDPNKATQMLEQLGWKKVKGTWHEPNGKVPHFIIGANSSWMPGVLSGEVAAEQLKAFGIPAQLIAADPSIEPTNAQNGKYDMSIDWVDAAFGFTSSWNALDYMFWGVPRQEIGFSDITKKGPAGNQIDTGHPQVKLTGLDGESVDVNQYLNDYPITHSAAKRQEMTDNVVYAVNQACFGIDFFQNVTGAWANVKMLGGHWPMKNEWQKYGRNLPLPTNEKDYLQIANMNLANGTFCINWVFDYWPN
ncbi:ABC transporter substrate-binding protein [Alicyclobacillus fodiniaquatilis]|uniref:ABC transporter substrate-binding protein n=1 Tax=Alicyclobacillus fodiniaquatilis TaxID=1661150 RepID=A0ABW4JNA7_9BACL